MTVVTRFAPSPTGFLHIGGARTALFNWLFSRHHGGRFLLRIEDTDRARSTQAAVDAIIEGLKWLGLPWDGEITYQFARAQRHAEIAHGLLATGNAYRCYASPEELTEMREKARAEGRPMRYDGRWRDRDPADAPAGVAPVIRFKAPQDGETVIRDLVQGEVKVANAQLDDMVLLRADRTPTYMLAVVVDDHDMAITHVIRGDDHLNNAFRQYHLYLANGWAVPEFAHIPLIHGADGAKLSKRHGAVGIEWYRDAGYLPETMRNYLLRLGWGHGDDEIISTEQAIAWFDVDAVGRSAARFDMAKLDNLNGHYMRNTSDDRLLADVQPFIEKIAGGPISETQRKRVIGLIPLLKERTKNLIELAENTKIILTNSITEFDPKARQLLDPAACERLRKLREKFAQEPDWTAPALEAQVRNYADAEALKLKDVAQPLRAALTGRTISPPIFDVLALLGRELSLARLDQALAGCPG